MIGVAGTGNLVERVISAATQAVVVPLVPTALIVPKATVAIVVPVAAAVIRMTKTTMKRRNLGKRRSESRNQVDLAALPTTPSPTNRNLHISLF